MFISPNILCLNQLPIRWNWEMEFDGEKPKKINHELPLLAIVSPYETPGLGGD